MLSRKLRGGAMRLGGVTVREDEQMLLLVGAANRDPQRHADPTTFDIFRKPKGHLGFGFGLHHCLGAALARMETSVAMPRFLKAAPDYAIEGEITYSNPHARSPDAVTIRLQ
jgi:cytochrome P450